MVVIEVHHDLDSEALGLLHDLEMFRLAGPVAKQDVRLVKLKRVDDTTAVPDVERVAVALLQKRQGPEHAPAGDAAHFLRGVGYENSDFFQEIKFSCRRSERITAVASALNTRTRPSSSGEMPQRCSRSAVFRKSCITWERYTALYGRRV